MAKIDKTQYTKEEFRKLKEQKRLQKLQNENAPLNVPAPNKLPTSKVAFVLGNGISRASIELQELFTSTMRQPQKLMYFYCSPIF